jgi:predicted O-methyltransferase YrrM
MRRDSVRVVAEDPKSFFLTADLHRYLMAHAEPIDDVQRWLRHETRVRFPDWAFIQIPPEEGAFLTLLTRLVGARRAVEVGTFTGYSALCIARGLPDDGHLLCCDVNEEWTTLAREAWEKAGVAARVELLLAPGIDTLRALPADEEIDLAFLDADKASYPLYYEELVRRLRPNGVLLADNVLWGGDVTEPEPADEHAAAVRAFNDLVAADDRVESLLLTVGDGLTLARKR